MNRLSTCSRRCLSLGLAASFAATSCTTIESDRSSLGPEALTPPGYLAYRAQTPIIVDGVLDDLAWNDASWSARFRDIQGDARPEPKFDTHVKMLWDDTFLYVAARIEEPHVWGTLTEHDSVIFNDDDFEVFIDPDGDRHQYYEFEINALGTGWDLRLVKPYTDGGPALNEWEIPGLRSAVHVDGTLNDPSDVDTGWSVELAFPWAAFAEFAGGPCPPEPGAQWRISFSRVDWTLVEGTNSTKVEDAPEDNWTWTNQHAINMHLPEHWGCVQFVNDAPGTAVYQPDASHAARATLVTLHHAQRNHHETHERYAESFDDLGLPAMPGVSMLQTDAGYSASVPVVSGELNGPYATIRQDGRLRVVDGPEDTSR